MTTRLAVVALVAVLLGPAAGGQHADETKHVAVKPDALQWGPAPPGLPAGSQVAVLSGDPTKAGPYVMRAKMPDGYTVSPHWHPTDENITVLSGTFLIGEGESFDASKLEEMPAGSFVRMPKTMRHFAKFKGETVIQLHGTGPFEITYVNSADDPRKKDK